MRMKHYKVIKELMAARHVIVHRLLNTEVTIHRLTGELRDDEKLLKTVTNQILSYHE